MLRQVPVDWVVDSMTLAQYLAQFLRIVDSIRESPSPCNRAMRSTRIFQLGLFVLDSFSIRRASRIAGWLLLGLITILSLSPASYRPVTPLGHYVEHFFIHGLVGLSFGIGYARRWSLLALGLVALTGAIEFAQLFVPGRHASLRDF